MTKAGPDLTGKVVRGTSFMLSDWFFQMYQPIRELKTSIVQVYAENVV